MADEWIQYVTSLLGREWKTIMTVGNTFASGYAVWQTWTLKKTFFVRTRLPELNRDLTDQLDVVSKNLHLASASSYKRNCTEFQTVIKKAHAILVNYAKKTNDPAIKIRIAALACRCVEFTQSESHKTAQVLYSDLQGMQRSLAHEISDRKY